MATWAGTYAQPPGGHPLGGTSGHYPTLLRHARLGRPAVITNGKKGAREVGGIPFRRKSEIVSILPSSA
jgi:hypothetical protein